MSIRSRETWFCNSTDGRYFHNFSTVFRLWSTTFNGLECHKKFLMTVWQYYYESMTAWPQDVAASLWQYDSIFMTVLLWQYGPQDVAASLWQYDRPTPCQVQTERQENLATPQNCFSNLDTQKPGCFPLLHLSGHGRALVCYYAPETLPGPLIGIKSNLIKD